MILAIDVQYSDPSATAAGILFGTWKSTEIDNVIIKNISQVAPYESGAFYKRELPCIIGVLTEIHQELEAIVIDGYVTLGMNGKPGLGMHLYRHLERKIPVIGVAKTEFSGTPAECRLRRGNSRHPLFITAAGISLAEAKFHISSMHGSNRIPNLLKKVDQFCRGK